MGDMLYEQVMQTRDAPSVSFAATNSFRTTFMENHSIIKKVLTDSQFHWETPTWIGQKNELVKKMIALVRPLEQFIRVFYSCWRCQTWFRLSVLFSKQHVCSLFLADLHLWSKFVAFLFISSRTEVMIELISKFNGSCEPTAQYIWFLLWICGHDFCCWSR